MDDMAKLNHLLHHWKEHNDEHAATYREWAAKAEQAGRSELAETLRGIYGAAKNLSSLFDEAMKKSG